MLSLSEAFSLAAAVGAGLIAGLCFAFASFLMRSFDALGAPAAIRTMQSVNTTILRSSAMVVWFGTAALGVAAALLAKGNMATIVAAVLYGIGAILITGRGNVPLNEALDRFDPDALAGDPSAAETVWRDYRVAWGRWNGLRTVVCAVASAGFVLGL